MIDDALLASLMNVEAASGDELRLTRFLAAHLRDHAAGARLQTIGNTLIAIKGAPKVCVFAHIDSVGFTLGHRANLLPIGHPMVRDGTPVRCTIGERVHRGRVEVLDEDEPHYRLTDGDGPPGSAWVYDTQPALGPTMLQGAYIDNRFGVYTGLHLLRELDDVAVAFTAGEEASTRGACDAGRWLYENTTIREALIADITWATDDVRPGKGPALSLRDAFIPRRAFFDRVRGLAETAGIPFQLEIIGEGASDGAALERSGLGFDWLFVGAPENGYHTAMEFLLRADAENMLRLYAHLVTQLTRQGG